jgi:hypothetical protein
MKKTLILLFFATFWVVEMVFGQEHLAFGLKARCDVGRQNNTNFVLSASIGYAKELNVILDKGGGFGALLSFQFGVNLYRGGLGNSKLPTRIDDHQLDLYNCFAVTPGFWANRKSIKSFRESLIRPLYTWNANYATNINNPYQFSATLATNFLWNFPINNKGFFPVKQKKSKEYDSDGNKLLVNRSQRIGFIGFGLGRVISAGYYNDGPPYDKIFSMGDGFDRYWTGGGFVHIGTKNWIDSTVYSKLDNHKLKSLPQFIFSFDKFTGYSPNSYELSNMLKLKYVPYKQEEMSSYNRSNLRYALLFNDGIGLALSTYDDSFDVQDKIHDITNYSHHPNIYNKGLTFGVQNIINQSIKLKK